ncbi:hypothetical protein BCR34DRAFT_594627 [Clohesyomyces aquaticus]|uniref:Uncharacterized protein n=1 Tax=Clohesyomyces aquaticus TaxID=1231657 RepID=A0A1Y1Y6J1_9PLEO|nr:hypothetical protein BCR34DRAFT_594627 [Clohesyomyces aquaticus]
MTNPLKVSTILIDLLESISEMCGKYLDRGPWPALLLEFSNGVELSEEKSKVEDSDWGGLMEAETKVMYPGAEPSDEEENADLGRVEHSDWGERSDREGLTEAETEVMYPGAEPSDEEENADLGRVEHSDWGERSDREGLTEAETEVMYPGAELSDKEGNAGAELSNWGELMEAETGATPP